MQPRKMQKNFSVFLRAYRRSRFLHHLHFFKVIGFILDEREDFFGFAFHGQFLRDEGNGNGSHSLRSREFLLQFRRDVYKRQAESFYIVPVDLYISLRYRLSSELYARRSDSLPL